MAENATTPEFDYSWNPFLVCNKGRRKTSADYWKKPFIWNRQASVDRRVFNQLLRMTPDSSGEIARELFLQHKVVYASLNRLVKRGYVLESPARPGDRLEWQLSDLPTWKPPRVFLSACDLFEDWQGPIVNVKGERCVFHRYDNQVVSPHPNVSMDDQYATMDHLRAYMFWLIDHTPNLDYLIRTKHPENIRKIWPETSRRDGKLEFRVSNAYRPNVHLLYSASYQDQGLDMLAQKEN